MPALSSRPLIIPLITATTPRGARALSVLASRPADILRLLDLMLSGWKDRAAIDPAHIGFFGIFAGAYTGLVHGGTQP